MGKIILYVVGAVCAYLVGGINPAIVMSKLIYHKDIRTLGSKNPGFTNFKRVFGGKYAWLVFALDLLKSALLCVIFGPIFAKVCGSFSLGAAYVGAFCHARTRLSRLVRIYGRKMLFGWRGGRLVC